MTYLLLLEGEEIENLVPVRPGLEYVGDKNLSTQDASLATHSVELLARIADERYTSPLLVLAGGFPDEGEFSISRPDGLSAWSEEGHTFLFLPGAPLPLGLNPALTARCRGVLYETPCMKATCLSGKGLKR